MHIEPRELDRMAQQPYRNMIWYLAQILHEIRLVHTRLVELRKLLEEKEVAEHE